MTSWLGTGKPLTSVYSVRGQEVTNDDWRESQELSLLCALPFMPVYPLYLQLTDLPLFFSQLICQWCRVEFDAYRSDLEYYKEAPRTEINQLKIAETQVLLIIWALLENCGTVTICCGSGSDFGKGLVPVPDPDNILHNFPTTKNL
jgi:hypothetical protein